MSESVKTLATMPCSFGSIGIRKPSHVSLPAFLASVNATKPLTQQILNNNSFNSTIDSDILPANAMWNNMSGCESLPTDRTQRNLDIILVTKRHNELLRSVQQSEQARLQNN